MLENGYIRLHRSLTGWRWYREPKTLALWLHILLNANYEPRDMGNKTIERGQMATSLASLSEHTGLTVKEVRTSLDRLKKTGEIVVWSNPHMSVITISNYDMYQSNRQIDGTQMADQGQTEGRPRADQGQSKGNNEKKIKKQKEKKDIPPPPYDEFGFSDELRERLDEWLAYKIQRKDTYTEMGLRKLLSVVRRECRRVGEQTVMERIDQAIASGWQGMNLDKLEVHNGDSNGHAQNFASLAERI